MHESRARVQDEPLKAGQTGALMAATALINCVTGCEVSAPQPRIA
jgi:hypothetical protein